MVKFYVWKPCYNINHDRRALPLAKCPRRNALVLDHQSGAQITPTASEWGGMGEMKFDGGGVGECDFSVFEAIFGYMGVTIENCIRGCVMTVRRFKANDPSRCSIDRSTSTPETRNRSGSKEPRYSWTPSRFCPFVYLVSVSKGFSSYLNKSC